MNMSARKGFGSDAYRGGVARHRPGVVVFGRGELSARVVGAITWRTHFTR